MWHYVSTVVAVLMDMVCQSVVCPVVTSSSNHINKTPCCCN